MSVNCWFPEVLVFSVHHRYSAIFFGSDMPVRFQAASRRILFGS